jgi:hypothetical protein
MSGMLPLIRIIVFSHYIGSGTCYYIIFRPATGLTYLGEESGTLTSADPRVKNLDPLAQHKLSSKLSIISNIFNILTMYEVMLCLIAADVRLGFIYWTNSEALMVFT